MEDGGENFEIAEADADPEEGEEISRGDSMVFDADPNIKISSISELPIQDSNESRGMDSESEEEDGNHRFHIPVAKAKEESDVNEGEESAIDSSVQPGMVLPQDGNIQDQNECGSLQNPVEEDLIMSSELSAEDSQPPISFSNYVPNLRPDMSPHGDSFDTDKMEVDLSESDHDGDSPGASSEIVLESASALVPASPIDARTEVSNILQKKGFGEMDNCESFSETVLLKDEENENDYRLVDSVDKRTECKEIYRVQSFDKNESLDQCKWNEELMEERLCPNGDSISPDSSLLDGNQHDHNLSGTLSSPLSRLNDLEREPLNEPSSKQICDSEQSFVNDNETKEVDNGICANESENLDLSYESNVEDQSSQHVQLEDGVENSCKVSDKAVQDEIGNAEAPIQFSTAAIVNESQCNGNIDICENSNEDNVEWCDTVNTSSGQIEENLEEEDGNEELSIDGKRKQSFDVDVGENSVSGIVEGRSSTKMFKIDSNVAHLGQQTTVDRGSTMRTPCGRQPLDGSALFPGNIQANSQINEYAQYLGLQPTVKFKCVRCGEKSFSSMMDLKTHQYACLKSHTPSQPNPSPAPFTPVQTSSTNFRITRKVYLCSVCGTYYENWNLFLHMREVHKRHICLFCLGMFSQAERLSAHLVAKHNIVEGHYGTAEEFRLSCKGSVFLMCCTCEKVFSEEDSFSNHPCKDRSSTIKPNLPNNGLVSAKNQPSNLSSMSSSLAMSEKSKQVGEVGAVGKNVNPRSSETKTGHSGKGTAANPARPKQILKVKIPMQPKKPDINPSTKALAKSSSSSRPTIPLQPPIGGTYPRNGFETIQSTGMSDACLDSLLEGAISADKPSGGLLSLSATDANVMSNLDKTINAVALGISSEGIEWQQRKNKEEIEELKGLEEPVILPCLDGAAKSDSDSDSQSISNFGGDENIDHEVPSVESSTEKISETQVGIPEEPIPPTPIPDAESSKSDHESFEQPQMAEEALPNVQPEIEQQQSHFLTSPTPPPAEEPVENPVNSPVESPVESPVPQPPSPVSDAPNTTEKTPTEAEEVSDADSDDSDKLSLVVDENASGAENEEINPEKSSQLQSGPCEPTVSADVPNEEDPLPNEELTLNEPNVDKAVDIQLAGDDVPVTEVVIEELLEDIPIQALLKECVKTLCYVCVYCSHARRIAVNGKQLALHTLAEHRFSPVDGSDNQDQPPIARFTSRLKDSVHILQDVFFNTDTYDSSDKSSCLPYDRTYECFHCHFFTRSHKELYIHNRKMHQKTILLCIMCKSNFYSYSELLCHMCPGIYIPQCNIGFHCCMCDVDNLPSAFRLMVHLRKKHHACDVCLEITDDQQKLSSHVWKHKLHHLCYRCGIAYRNKPDITNHLFWKHGTESVLCKKCLQKKWPHVYHFCVPPATFTCDECNSLFTRAVSLRVHKRIHTGEQPHHCTDCEEKFISKRLLAKHFESHRIPPPEEKSSEENEASEEKIGLVDRSTESVADTEGISKSTSADDEKEDKNDGSHREKDTKEDDKDKKHLNKKKKHKEKEEQKQKKVVDVYDLPPLNLSSESDSSDDEGKKDQPPPSQVPTFTEPIPSAPEPEPVEEAQPAQVVDGIWDKFQNYKASLEKLENAEAAGKKSPEVPEEDPNEAIFKVIMMDHDYCLPVDPSKVNEAVPEMEVKEDLDKNEVPATETQPTVTADPEIAPNEENPAVTPPHTKDDSNKSIMSSESPSKKKRSPKKKMKRRSSSSSSNSSSGSDSSSCSCGTNCSCSSSSSSDSSSSSSDSDSSSSEGKRRALARREQRKERALEKKKEEEAATSAATSAAPAVPGPAAVEEPHIDVMEAEPTFRESDLDTTETDTDEDFYDERPQKLPDESLVEKRNLMLLASVAPLNNGSVSPVQAPAQQEVQALPAPSEQSLHPQYSVPELNPAAVTGSKKRTKKRKKKQTSRFHPKMAHSHPQAPDMPAPTHTANVLLDSQGQSAERFMPTYYPVGAPSPIPPVVQRHPMNPSFQQSTPEMNSKKPLVTKLTRELIPNPGSGSETEGRTKRKRMPNKFYGYSSDEDAEDHQSTTQKWRKTESTVSQPPPPPIVPPIQRMPVSPLTLKRTVPSVQEPPPPITLQLSKSLITTKTDSDSEESKRVTSSSSSTDSDDDAMQISEVPPTAPSNSTIGVDAPVRESNDNLYCYCQCPYDEVSEMIACDGKNCAIEWFHFECVGIMVPPKGQWYCPDCRKHMTGYQGSE